MIINRAALTVCQFSLIMGLIRVVCLFIVYIFASVSSLEYPCECVPYYLCDVNGFIITDGTGIINERLGRVKCDDPIAACCKVPPQSTDQPSQNPSVPSQACTPSLHEPPHNPNIPISQPNPYPSPTNPKPESPSPFPFPFPSEDDTEPADPCRMWPRPKNNTGDDFAKPPWMVALLIGKQKPYNFKCGGSLITPTIIMTAAHCVKNVDFSSLVAVAGKWDSQSIESTGHQERRLARIILHPDFTASNLHYDIAVMSTVTPFDITPTVNTICLPTALLSESSFDNARCYISGWGKDAFGNGGPGGQYQTKMKVVEVPKLPRNQCQALFKQTRLGKFFLFHNSFICAGGELGKDSCEGDGGGPLICPDPSWPGQTRWVQAGIVSWGLECGEKSIPSAYTNVPFLTTWIIDQIGVLQRRAA